MTNRDDRSTRREVLTRGGALALLASGATGALGAAARAAIAAQPRRGGTLRVALNDGGAGDTLSPWNNPTFSSGARAAQVYERLFTYDHTYRAAPRLAVSAEPNKDSTVWRLKLRRNVHFHSGRPLTADDVLYSLRYVANPANKAESMSRIEPIDLRASRKVSQHEIELHLKRPIGDLPGLLADRATWIAPAGKTDFAKRPDGTGPFEFVSWQPGVRAQFKRNPSYWGVGPYVDGLQLLFIPDETARVNALLGNQVDEITYLSFSQAKALRSNAAIQIIQTSQGNTNPFYVQIDSAEFRDSRVRQALRLAVDREAMVRNVEVGFGSVGNDLIGRGFPSYNAGLPQRRYDPEKAKSLLKAAGHDSLRIVLPSSDALPGMIEAATAWKQQAKAAGIDVVVQRLDGGSYFANNKYLKVPSYQTNWTGPFESMAADALLKNSPYNETHWYSTSWGSSFRKAQAISDRARRVAAYKDLQVPLWKSGGYIVYAFYNTIDAASSKVHGILPDPAMAFANLGAFDFRSHWLA